MIITKENQKLLIPGKLYKISEFRKTENNIKQYFNRIYFYETDPPYDKQQPGFYFNVVAHTDEPNTVVMFVKLQHVHIWNHLVELFDPYTVVQVLYKGRVVALNKNVEFELVGK
jgi:hypothetical protein